ncbi:MULTISPECIES: phosphopantetheine-binding protein [Agathobacter]|uniref:Acyl carrier protein n=1 Tax=Agathobacter ruminis TaxID=1712665 RepID=A0A2G3E4Q2_9FIRM|nr:MULTISPECIES: phosphopantetheine-binding protein [Agathobacter]MBQ1681048.1 acyl carrier protein [Agathobacter sp.]MCR5676432.1 acyl carrier protein [Agathobacter sp.]MDC7301410.1 phosphopantetheine-binding protein [Agathobacter ruminis]PHU38234.1 acyl carrier protein [Agathobacter ruminis]
MSTREQLMEILEELRPDIDFENEQALIDDHIMESFDVVALVSSLADEFDITVRPKDLLPKNFNNVDAMVELIERLMEE